MLSKAFKNSSFRTRKKNLIQFAPPPQNTVENLVFIKDACFYYIKFEVYSNIMFI